MTRQAAMLDMLFIIGSTISGALLVYGAYLAIAHALSGKRTQTASTAEELPESWHSASYL
jgi:hypothetical protein